MIRRPWSVTNAAARLMTPSTLSSRHRCAPPPRARSPHSERRSLNGGGHQYWARGIILAGAFALSSVRASDARRVAADSLPVLRRPRVCGLRAWRGSDHITSVQQSPCWRQAPGTAYRTFYDRRGGAQHPTSPRCRFPCCRGCRSLDGPCSRSHVPYAVYPSFLHSGGGCIEHTQGLPFEQ